jgi:undecaprenyl-diphosphatase
MYMAMGAFRLLENSGESSGDPAESSVVDQIASVISAISDHGIGIVVLVGLGVLTKRFSLRAALIALALVGFSSLGLSIGSKRLVKKERPDEPSPAAGFVRTPSSSSFPSGHTLAAATAAVAFPASALGVSVGLIGATGVAWSRVHVKAHDAVDVVGGVGFGIALGLILRRAVQAILRSW